MFKTILLFMGLSAMLTAQMSKLELEEKVPSKELKEWGFQTSLGASFNWIASKNYVGLTDSPTATPTLQSSSQLKFKKYPHAWRSYLTISEGFTYSDPPNAWVKKADSVFLDSIYLYYFTDWLGVFARANMQTSFFQSWDQKDHVVDYVITDIVTKNVTNLTSVGLQLTDSFLPLILGQQAGVFVQFFERKDLSLEFRLGAAGRENFAAGQKVITSIGASATNLTTLANVYELGPASGIIFHGQLLSDKISYFMSFDTLYVMLQDPVVNPAWSTQRISFDCTGQLNFSLLSWLSLNWNAQVLKNPVIVDKVQLMSNLMLAVNYAI